MLRTLPAVALVIVLAAACAGGGGAGGGEAGTTTAPAIASVNVTRSGGLAGKTVNLVIPPGDRRLGAIAHALPLPLPPSADVRRPGCADCLETEITVVLTDGAAATWRYDEDPPDAIAGLAQWVDQAMGP
jgi:hypothetical protein